MKFLIVKDDKILLDTSDEALDTAIALSLGEDYGKFEGLDPMEASALIVFIRGFAEKKNSPHWVSLCTSSLQKLRPILEAFCVQIEKDARENN